MTSIVRCAVAIAMFSAIAGCGGHDSLALWRDDLESECGGSACGWTQIAGPAGAATWIETVPSEHGISLVGTGVAVAREAEGDELRGRNDGVRSLRAHIVARCDVGSELSLIVTVRSTMGGDSIDVTGDATFPAEWDGSRTSFPLVPDGNVDAGSEFSDITSVVIHKVGAGACEVDYISLADDAIGFTE